VPVSDPESEYDALRREAWHFSLSFFFFNGLCGDWG